MSKPRTERQHRQDDNKSSSSGKFQKGPTCEFCGKAAGHDYMSDAESLEIDHLGLTLCARKRCEAKRDAMPLEERRAAYKANEAGR